MRLEDAIQQRRFPNEHVKVMVNLLYSHSWLEEQIKLFLQEADVTMQQYNILRILRGAKQPVSTMQIRERMLDRMSDTSRIIDRMIKKGIVEKKINEQDKRLVDITITAKGSEALAIIDQQQQDIDNIVALKLSSSEAKMLNDLLDKMRG